MRIPFLTRRESPEQFFARWHTCQRFHYYRLLWGVPVRVPKFLVFRAAHRIYPDIF